MDGEHLDIPWTTGLLTQTQQPQRHLKLVRTLVFTWKGGNGADATFEHICHHAYHDQRAPLSCPQFGFQVRLPCSAVTYVPYDPIPAEQMDQDDQQDGDDLGAQANNTLPAALQEHSALVPPEDTDPSTWDTTATQYAAAEGHTQLVIPVAPS